MARNKYSVKRSTINNGFVCFDTETGKTIYFDKKRKECADCAKTLNNAHKEHLIALAAKKAYGFVNC